MSRFVASKQSCRGCDSLWVIEGPRLISLNEESGQVVRDVRLPPEHGSAMSLCCTGDGPASRIWVGFSSGTIAILEASPILRIVSESVLHEGGVTGLKWVPQASSASEDVVVSIATDGRAAMWSTATFECLTCVWVSHATLTAIATVSVSPGRLQVVIGTASGNLHSLCPFQQEEAMLVAGAHAGEVRQIAISPHAESTSDVARVWTVGTDGSLCVWEASRHRVGVHRSFFRVLSKSPLIQLDAVAGHQILSFDLSNDARQVLCVLAEGQHFATIDAATGAVGAVWSVPAPLGDPVLLAPTFRKGWSAVDGQCHDVPTPRVALDAHTPPSVTASVIAMPQPDPLLERSLRESRQESQRLREQIQVLLRSPLQRSPSADAHSAGLLQMKSCYASALGVLDNMEQATREFIFNLERDTREDAASWMAFAQRGSINTESARRLHSAVQELHEERVNVSRVTHELTELRLRFSSAQQREDVAVMEVSALKQQLEQDRDVILQLERKLTDSEAQVLETRRSQKLLQESEVALRLQVDKTNELLLAASHDADTNISTIQQSLDIERLTTEKLRSELLSVTERSQVLREQLAAAVASESSTLQRVSDLQQQMEQQHAERLQRADDQYRSSIAQLHEEISNRKAKETSLEQLIVMLREESSLHAQDAAVRRDKLTRQQRAVSETSAAMIDALHDEVHSLRQQVSELFTSKTALESERDSLLDQVQSHRHVVKDELLRMEAEVLNLHRHAKDETVVSEVAIAQRRISVLETELSITRNELDAVQLIFKKQRVALEDKILHQASDLEGGVAREAELSRRALAAEKKFRELEQTQQDEHQLHREELLHLRTQLAALRDIADKRQSDDTDVHERISALSAQHKVELLRAREQLAALQAAHDEEVLRLSSSHRVALSAKVYALQEMRDDLDAKQREVDRLLHQKQLVESRLQDDVAAERTANERRLAQAVSGTAALQTLLAEKDAELQQLRAKCDEEKHTITGIMRRERASHEDAVAAAEEKVHKLKRDLKQQAADHVQALAAIEAKHHDGNKSTHQTVAALQSRLERTETALAEAKERERQLHVAITESKETIADTITSHELKLQAERRSFAKQLDDANAATAAEAHEATLAKDELGKVLKALAATSKDKALYQTEAEDLQVQLQLATDKLAASLQEADHLTRRIETLQRSAVESESLKRQRDDVEAAHDHITAEAQRLAREKRHLEHDLKQLREQVNECREVNDILRQAVEDEKDIVKQKDSELSRSKRSYDALCASNAQQQQELAHLQEQHRIVVANLHAHELAQRDKDAVRRWQPPAPQTPVRSEALQKQPARMTTETSVVSQWVRAATTSRSPSSASRGGGGGARHHPTDLQQFA